MFLSPSPGVGIATVMVTLIVSIYYNVIIAYSLYYMFASFQSLLPWSSCLSWADANCTDTPTGALFNFPTFYRCFIINMAGGSSWCGILTSSSLKLNRGVRTVQSNIFLSLFSSVLQCEWCFSDKLDSGKQLLSFFQHAERSNAEPE